MAGLSKSDQILIELAKISTEQANTKEDIVEFKDHINCIKKSVAKIDKRQAVLEVKAGLWGTIGGMITTVYFQIKHTIGF